MKKIILILSISLSISHFSFGQTDAEYTKTLKEMIKVSGTEQTYQAAVKQIFVMFKQQSPNVKPEFWEELEKELSSTSMNDLVEMLVPVYKKYMTQDDLREMINFYQTQAGQKFAKNTPLIMQESMQIGQEWGKKLR